MSAFLFSMRFQVCTLERGWIHVNDPTISSTTNDNDDVDISEAERICTYS
jgi:hypothetical protein